MRQLLSIIFLGSIAFTVHAQSDKALLTINNDNIQFEFTRIASKMKNDTLRMHPYVVKITAPQEAVLYAKHEKNAYHLIELLKRENQDWAANVLLYAITQRDGTLLLEFDSNKAESWRRHQKESDVAYWKSNVLMPPSLLNHSK